MVETDLLVKTSEKVNGFLGGEMEFYNGLWHLEKRRDVKVLTSSGLYVSWSLDLSVTYEMTIENHKAINQAEVFLLPEELLVFIGELIRHPIFFPTRYSQQLSTERGMYCLRITSHESPEHFAERLSDSLRTLE
ncbi:hypothetical protein B481_1573 [Planococcus halocryophilus Or1]|uniref:Uncharacterized protein n=1 Tax=Planococcus halocryophilus TaxID=1215089 RepID=A0A1C7DNX8_9BACL|nr:hypothetical protein [Planococcus halocryophilus]ANU13175.1 hypothetical protein BBI08_04665 [Planococcus halocryophilus]EMF46843.1 hypothetical protein B481_1573 [Planococcus halocryophilus Or1]